MEIDVSWPRDRESAWRGWDSVISTSGALWQWRTVFRSSVSSFTPSFPALLISHFVQIREGRKGMAVLSLIGFDFGGTQLPADRTVHARVSVPPAGAAEMIAARISETAGQTSQWGLPTQEHERPNRQLVLHRMSVMGCPTWNSVNLLTYWKSLLLWLEQDMFSPSPLLLCIFLSLFLQDVFASYKW